MHLICDGNPFSVFEPKEEKDEGDVDDVVPVGSDNSADDPDSFGLFTFLITTISQTGIAGFEKQIEIKLAFWTSSSKNLYVRGKCMLFFWLFMT